MTRSRLGVLGLCAVVLGMMAITASAAQGTTLSWLVLNASHTTATELLATLLGKRDSEHLILLTKIVKLMFSVTCNNFALINTNINTGGTIETGGQVTFMGCAVYQTAPLTNKLCDVKTAGQANGTILTSKLKGKLVLHTLTGGGTEVLAEIVPDSLGPFATLLFSGDTCALPDQNEISGSLFFKDCLKQATTHVLEHLVEVGPLTSLFVGADTAEHLETSLIGSGWVALGGVHKACCGNSSTGCWPSLDGAGEVLAPSRSTI